MIKFQNLCRELPYLLFKDKYNEALNLDQKNIEAVAISSFDKEKNEVDSRFVNLKFISNKEFIFFSNYESSKNSAFQSHNQIAATFFWQSINVQIRLKAKIQKTSIEFNKSYFKTRSRNKNALAISSNQSKKISSYDEVVKKYNKVLKNKDLLDCPDHWGGYSFTPFVFEFWEGNDFRLNRRDHYNRSKDGWIHSILEP